MSDYREIKDHLANTPLPAEIQEVVSEALDSPLSKARLAEAVLRLPDRATVEFVIRDAYEANIPADQRHGEAASAVMDLFIDENQEVPS